MSDLKEPLKVGDRVAVYGYSEDFVVLGDKGTVVRTQHTGLSNDLIDVKFDQFDNEHTSHRFHSKQCRRLVKPKRLIVTISCHPGIGDLTSNIADVMFDLERKGMNCGQRVDFIEVKKKK